MHNQAGKCLSIHWQPLLKPGTRDLTRDCPFKLTKWRRRPTEGLIGSCSLKPIQVGEAEMVPGSKADKLVWLWHVQPWRDMMVPWSICQEKVIFWSYDDSSLGIWCNNLYTCHLTNCFYRTDVPSQEPGKSIYLLCKGCAELQQKLVSIDYASSGRGMFRKMWEAYHLISASYFWTRNQSPSAGKFSSLCRRDVPRIGKKFTVLLWEVKAGDSLVCWIWSTQNHLFSM